MINEFEISYGSTVVPISPKAVSGLKIQEQPEGENIFFRRKLNEIKFKGEGFKLIEKIRNSTDACNEVGFAWRQACKEGDPMKTKFQGVFTVFDGKFDLDECEVAFTPKPDDVYRMLLDNYTREENILSGVQQMVKAIGRLTTTETFEFKEQNIGETSLQEDSETWATFLTITSWVEGDAINKGRPNKTEIIFRLTTERQLINGVAPDLSGRGWKLLDDTTGGVARYAKTPDIYEFKPYTIGSWGDWTKYPDLRLVAANAVFDSAKYVSLADNGAKSGDCGKGLRIRRKLDDTTCYNILWEFGTFTFTRNRPLLSVLKYLIGQADPTLVPDTDAELSSFFTAAINPVTKQPNKVRNPLVAQLSDLKAYRSSEAATKGMLSLSQLLSDLRAMFDLRWFVNKKGKFQIEHVSFFANQTSFDMLQPRFAKRLTGTKKFEFLKAKMPRFEKLQFASSESDEFAQAVIEYLGNCVVKEEGQDTQTISVARFTTDIEGLMINSQAFANDGFALIANDGSGVIPKELGGLDVRAYVNGHFSATKLFDLYHRYGRVLPSGLLNGRTVFFASVVPTLKQTDIRLELCCEEVDPTGFFITQLSSQGKATAITYEFDGFATFSILHSAFTATEGLNLPDAQFDRSFSLQFPA